MKKFVNIFLAVLITLFSFPINGLNVNAEGKVYDKIPNGEYELSITTSSNGTSHFLLQKATLIVEDGNKSIIIGYKNQGFELHWTKLENKDPVNTVQKEEGIYFTFDIDEVKIKYDASMEYTALPMKNHSVEYDLQLDEDELDEIVTNEEGNGSGNGQSEDPEQPEDPEEPKYTPAPEERVVGELVSEADAEEVYELEYETDSDSTSRQLENPVKLLVKDGNQFVQIPVSDRGAQFFRSLKFNGEEVIWNSIGEAPFVIQYELKDGIESTIDVSMVIDTGRSVMPHEDIKIWFDTENIKMTKVNDKRVTGAIINEGDADSVQLYEFATDSPATARQLKNPVKVLEKDDKKYLQIEVSGAQFFRSLTFNNEEVVWNSITEAPFVIQYELKDGIESTIDVSMVIDTGRSVMPHSGIKLWLENTVSEIELGQEKSVKSNDRMNIANSGDSLKTPKNLPNDVSVKITSKTDDIRRFGDTGDLEIAGEIFEFQFTNLPNDHDEFELTFEFDEENYPTEQFDIDIYYFDDEKQEWIPQGATVTDGKVTLMVDHFSVYGVFAVEKPEPVDEPEEKSDDDSKDNEVKYSIDYVLKQDSKDEVSAADSFFEKPGFIIERDGKTYFQATVTGWNYFIEERIKHNGQAVKIVSVNEQDNSAVIEFEITGELSEEMILEMFLFYGNHDARLILDPDSMELIEDEKDLTPGNNGGTTPTPVIPGTGGTDNKGNTNDTGNQQPSDKITPDQAFEFNYTIWKEDKDEVSAANNFFTGVGHLLKKNGKQYIQLEIDGWQFVDWIKVMKTGKLVDLIKVENDKALVQFEYNGSITDVIWLEMSITVPGVYNGEVYKTRLVVDQDSIKEVNPEDHTIFIAKPDLTGDKGDKSDKKNATNNPKTGDTSQVMFYTMLLIASLFVLGYQIRKQRAISA